MRLLRCSFKFIFRDSSMVEHAAVNRRVVGSSPTRGAVRLTPPAMVGFFFGGVRSPLLRSPHRVSRTALSEGAPLLRSIIAKGRPSRRAPTMSAWFYILRLQSSNLYSGSTRSLEKRVRDHFAGRACRTTKIDHAVALVYSEEFPSYKEAFRREHQVKHWSRAKKEALVSGNLRELKKLVKKKR